MAAGAGLFLQASGGQTAFMPKTSITADVSLCAAMPVPEVSGAAEARGAPEWVHLLPAGEIRRVDGRGPYRVASLHALAALLKPGDKLPIDENHAIDRAVPQGQGCGAGAGQSLVRRGGGRD